MMKRALALLALPLLLLGCGDEEPVGIGSELLPHDALRSFEVVLEPSQYLLTDTSFALYGGQEDILFTLMANKFEGVLDAHSFVRFDIPGAIGVKDTAGITVTDTMPIWQRGEVVLFPDTLTVDTTKTVHVALNAITEAWVPGETDWTNRSTATPWRAPGGTAGALIDTALVRRDSIVLQVDSSTIRLWRDSANAMRGGILSLVQSGTRLRTSRPILKLYAKSKFAKADTVFVVTAQSPQTRIGFTPVLSGASSDIRFNGVPQWRAFLHFRPDLRNVTVSCGAGCTLPLSAASVTRAELVLQPKKAPPGFTPETSLAPVAYTALLAPAFPLERSPLGSGVGTVSVPLIPSRFFDGAPPVFLVVTDFVRTLVADSTTATPSTQNPQHTEWLAILPVQNRTFGVGTFAAGPKLRLVLSTAKEIQLP